MRSSNYSISDLEQLSGIKAHTIRIWEQRYQLIHPKRTQTNIRFYDNQDLKLILNVAMLKENGYKISHIAKMNEEDRHEKILKLIEENLGYSEQIKALTLSMIDLDEERFEKIIASCILKLSFERTMVHIIYPFLAHIGILWQTGAITPGQEHFMSNLIRQKLITAIDGLYSSPPTDADKYVLFLPEGELHELPLLFADYLIKSKQHRTIYLGQSLPYADLKQIVNHHQPSFLLTMITNPLGDIENYLLKLANQFSKSTILVSGLQTTRISNHHLAENLKIYTRPEELINQITK